MLHLFKVIAVDGPQGLDLVLVDFEVIRGGDYGGGKRRRFGVELLLLRPGRAVLGGMIGILLLFVRHSGALGGVESELPRNETKALPRDRSDKDAAEAAALYNSERDIAEGDRVAMGREWRADWEEGTAREEEERVKQAD